MTTDTTAQLRKGFTGVIILFGAFSALLIWGGWYASGIAPNLLWRNYRSIQFASGMQSTLLAMYLDAVDGHEPSSEDVRLFDENLSNAKANITEPREPQILEQITAAWNAFREKPVTPGAESFQRVADSIKELSVVNETAMLAYEETAINLRYTFILGGVMGLALVLLYAWQIAYTATDLPER